MVSIAARFRADRAGRGRTPVALGLATVLLGGFAAYAHLQARSLTGTAAARNSALTDGPATSELTGQVTTAVNSVFSYDFTDTAKTGDAAKRLLTGAAVRQYDTLFAQVRQQAPSQRTVLTTTVTQLAVRLLHGDHARLLVFADQRDVRTTDGRSSYAAAMLAVDAVRQDGRWKISGIDTFQGTR